MESSKEECRGGEWGGEDGNGVERRVERRRVERSGVTWRGEDGDGVEWRVEKRRRVERSGVERKVE